MSHPPSYQEKTDHAEITRKLTVDGTIASTDGNLIPDLGGLIRTYYVRPAGDNNNDGLTPATAFATLDYFLKQILPAQYMNGGFFVDITGCDEVLPTSTEGGYVLPLVNDVFIANPASFFFGFQGALLIHSDMVNFLTIPLANITSVTYDATTDQSTITTTLVLVPNQLIGKKVFQNGNVSGVVKSNTAAVVEVTATSFSLDALSDISIEDPGATLWESDFCGGTYGLGGFAYILEGIHLKTTVNAAIISSGAAEIDLNVCTVDTIFDNSQSTSEGFRLDNSYIQPSVEAANSTCFLLKYFGDQSFFKGISYVLLDKNTNQSLDVQTCAFDSCGPIVGYSIRTNQCDFITPTSSAISLGQTAVGIIDFTKINGSVGSPILGAALSWLSIANVPAGVGNGGNGVELTDGARVRGGAACAIRGGFANDVKIGNLAATTWALVNAAPNNRITDAGVNGDGSSAFKS